MKRPKTGSTPRQFAYATRMLNGEAGSKKEAALLSGFSMSTAENAKAKIETTEGYHNAMHELALKSNNLMLAALSEFQARGLKDFSNADLIKALNAIGAAWERVEKQRNPNKDPLDGKNRLAGIFQRKTVTETAVIGPASEEAAPPVPHETKDAEFVEKPSEEDMDF